MGHDMHSEKDISAKCAAPAIGETLVTTEMPLLGGDVDKHGCRASAGYLWCPSMVACIRPWESGIANTENFSAKCHAEPRTHECNCPPSFVLYPCSSEEYRA